MTRIQRKSLVRIWVAAVALLGCGFFFGYARTRSADAVPTRLADAPQLARGLEGPKSVPNFLVPPASPPEVSRGTGKGIAPPPRYHPRDPNEWQGQLINLDIHPECDTSSRCGLALACIKGLCGPCSEDAQCAQGEVCVLDQCLLSSNAKCRRRSDCPADEYCQLTGLSTDVRSNADMKALCSGAVPVPIQSQENAVPKPEDSSKGVETFRLEEGNQLLERLRNK